MSEAGKKYRREYTGAVAAAILIGAFIGGLIGLITWAVLIKKPPRPTALWFLVYIGVGLSVIFGVIVRLRRKMKKEQEAESAK